MENYLSYYKIFYTVANTKNISNAAKELYISQPAISKAITKLEQYLNTILFTRSSRGVALTYEGSLLYEQVKIAFLALSSGETQIRNAAEFNMGHLRIGVSTTLCKYILLPYLKRFIMNYPNVTISIACQSTYETLKLLEQGSIDIGLIGKPLQLNNVSYYSMGAIEDIFVASKHYLRRMNITSDLNLSQILENATLMLLDKQNITRQFVDSYLQTACISVNNFIEVTSMDLLIEFAKIGIGVACVIKHFVKEELEEGSLVELPFTQPMQKREIGFVCNPNNMKPKALEYFLSSMQ